MTNGDRIRNMTDEELAKFINAVACNSKGWCDDCPSIYGDYCSGLKYSKADERILSFVKEVVSVKVELTTKEILQRDYPAICNVTKLDCCYCSPCCSHRIDKE